MVLKLFKAVEGYPSIHLFIHIFCSTDISTAITVRRENERFNASFSQRGKILLPLLILWISCPAEFSPIENYFHSPFSLRDIPLHAVADQIEAQRAGKKFWDRGPPYLRVWMTVAPSPPPPLPLPEGLELSLTGPLRDLAIDIWASELWKFLTQQENPLVPEPNGTFFEPCNPMFWQFTRCLYSQELEDTIESLRQQISVLQSRARVLQEELDSGNRLSSSFSNSAVRDQDELWSNWRKKITSNKYITEWSAGFLSSSTQHYCLIFESEKYIYI